MQIEKLIIQIKHDFPSWGAPKIRERLRRLYPQVHTPAISTVHAVATSVFEQAFKDFGLPKAIRTDKGIPFSCTNALFGVAACQCGGCDLVSASSASSPVIQSRTDVTNACT